MSNKIHSGLTITGICSLILILMIVISNIQVLRVILGLPFLLLFPGYTLVCVLFPRKSDLDMIGRVALSLGLSVAITGLLGLGINYLPWGVMLSSILVSQIIFIALMSTVAWYRWNILVDEEKPDAIWSVVPYRQLISRKSDTALYFTLIIAILIAFGIFGYTVANPKIGERFTEFYILGTDEEADAYPKEVMLDSEGKITAVRYMHHYGGWQEAWLRAQRAVVEVQDDKVSVIAGIINNEQETLKYKVVITVAGIVCGESELIELANGNRWQEEVLFTPERACVSTKLMKGIGQPEEINISTEKSILVKSTSGFEIGDYIQIDGESAQIESIEGNTISLTSGFREYHPIESKVDEMHKAEFTLYKIREVGTGPKHTELFLTVGKGVIKSMVVNQGQSVSEYEIKIRIRENEKSKDNTRDSGLVKLDPRESWEYAFDFPPLELESNEIEFAMYRDGQLQYREKVSRPYPALHLWIHVSQNSEPM